MMNLKKIAFAEFKTKAAFVEWAMLLLVFSLLVFYVYHNFMREATEMMLPTTTFAKIFPYLLVGGCLVFFLILNLMEFLNSYEKLKEEVELLQEHGCNQEQIEIILNNRNDFWFLLKHLRGKKERIKVKENDERIKNLYKTVGIDWATMHLIN